MCHVSWKTIAHNSWSQRCKGMCREKGKVYPHRLRYLRCGNRKMGGSHFFGSKYLSSWDHTPASKSWAKSKCQTFPGRKTLRMHTCVHYRWGCIYLHSICEFALLQKRAQQFASGSSTPVTGLLGVPSRSSGSITSTSFLWNLST